jgi:hypothetical protein
VNRKDRSSRAALIAAFALAAGALVACAPPYTASTTITAAEIPARTEAAPPAAAPVAVAPVAVADEAPSTAPTEAPPGKLVCKTKSAVDGTTELFLAWSGAEAKGALRRVAPSGMAYLTPVRAQRHRSIIIVDEPNELDLMTHAALVTTQGGKQLMQLGGGDHVWSTCE